MVSPIGIEPMTRPAMRPALPTELQGTNLQIWCRLWDSNSRPTDYKSVALPTELRRHVDFLKTVFTHSGFIQSDILTAINYRAS